MQNVSELLGVVDVAPHPLDRFATILPADEYDQLLQAAQEARGLLDGRVVWNVNSTALGGGVVEMLRSLLPFARGAGVDARWLVIQAEPEFFRLTKRIHNQLHGSPGDGGDLGPAERTFYETVLSAHAEALGAIVNARDVVVLHDPQTAGLVPALRGIGAKVIWRCHVGADVPNPLVRRALDFLRPYVELADAYVFTRPNYVWEGLRAESAVIIPPSIDVFSPKNQVLSSEHISGILAAIGLVEGPAGETTFFRLDGSVGRVTRRADLLGGKAVPASGRVVTQVSRWDRLKDPLGVITGFVDHVGDHRDVHLIVAGPAVKAVSDDPEGLEVLNEARALWLRLPPDIRDRVHLVCFPMDDIDENAAMVNALQRHASIVVQKSLAEGFGLTVAEAMWKARAIVASRVGGIQDQLIDGKSGILVEATDLKAYGHAISALLDDPGRAKLLGNAAEQRCREEYLAPRHLVRYVTLLHSLLV